MHPERIPLHPGCSSFILPPMERLQPANTPRPNHDWEQAKVLYCAGHSTAKIGEMLGIPVGTVKAYAYRHRWDAVRQRAKPVLLEARITTTKAYASGREDGMEEEGRKVRRLLSRAVCRQMERMVETTPETLRDEMDVAAVLAKAAGVATTTYGWDRESITSTVRVGAMGDEIPEPVAAVDVARIEGEPAN